MCGIVGVLNFKEKKPVDKSLLNKMTNIISHRGPDGEGFYFDNQNGLGFGHRRLSIIDIEGGFQPMVSEDENYIITFNGEIYNYRELRNELANLGVSFKTNSDTEVLLKLYIQYGIDCLNKLNGIFAFGVWDKVKKELIIARDHLGIKPVYYFDNGSTFIFSSEIKAILQHPAYQKEIDKEAIDLYLTFRHSPSPKTLFRNIFLLPQGTFLKASSSGVSKYQYYWDSVSEINYSRKLDEWVELLSPATEKAVVSQMVSDVPISISLSGGVDSNTILSIVSSKSENKVASFTIGFTENEKYDEVGFAKKAEDFFKTKVVSKILSAEDYQEWFSSYIWHLEEPLGNESALAYYHVAKLAHDNGIKVLLNGQGADELFAGYPRHIGERYQYLFPSFSKFFLKPFLPNLQNEQLRRSLYALTEKDELKRFFLVYSIFLPREKEKLYKKEFLDNSDIYNGLEYLKPYFKRFTNHSSLDKMLYIDTRFSLPDNLLLAEDKMAMAASVEARVPFLDVDYVKLVESIPAKFKINKGTIKFIHKKNLKNFIPDEIINRKKIGFGNPMEKWLVNQLEDTFNEMVNDKDSIINQLFNKEYVQKLFADHKSKRMDFKRQLFLLFSLHSWYNRFFRT